MLLVCVVAGRDRQRGRAAHVRLRHLRARRGRAGAVARGAARGARWRGSRSRARWSPLVRRNRGRYGGYLSTRAWRCCSSAWPRRRPSRSSALVQLRPGQTEQVGDYAITYVEADLRGGAGAERAARAHRPRRAAQRPPRRRSAADADDLQVLLPQHGPEPRPDLALLRGRVDERGRARRRRAPRPVDGGGAGHRRGCCRASRRATRSSRTRPTTSAPTSAARSSARRCAA